MVDPAETEAEAKAKAQQDALAARRRVVNNGIWTLVAGFGLFWATAWGTDSVALALGFGGPVMAGAILYLMKEL